MDRDLFLHNSPHQFGDVAFTFQKHDKGRNFRALNFNPECWLMLLGFPLDYWEEDYIETAIASFGRLTYWEEDRRNMFRVIIRAQVTDLEDVPQFIVFTNNAGMQGLSWTIRCEILQQDLLGALPADEDLVPVGNNIEGLEPFNFFGFGQFYDMPQLMNNQSELLYNQEEWGQWLQNPVMPDAAPTAELQDLNQPPDDNPAPFGLNQVADQQEEMEIDVQEASLLHFDLNLVPQENM